jgi:hypothetical protein
MRSRWPIFFAAFLALADDVTAQQPVDDSAQTSPSGQAGGATSPVMTFNQLMRGILFPLGNTVFFAQADDPAAVARDPMPSASPNPLTGLFGGWEAVENSALALAETADLLLIPGRQCANGEEVEVENADWIKFVADYRDKSLAAYEAVLTKDQDAIVLAAGDLSDACLACHRVYRREPTRGDMSQRCIPGPPADRR